MTGDPSRPVSIGQTRLGSLLFIALLATPVALSGFAQGAEGKSKGSKSFSACSSSALEGGECAGRARSPSSAIIMATVIFTVSTFTERANRYGLPSMDGLTILIRQRRIKQA